MMRNIVQLLLLSFQPLKTVYSKRKKERVFLDERRSIVEERNLKILQGTMDLAERTMNLAF
jgi:hypothetical protein